MIVPAPARSPSFAIEGLPLFLGVSDLPVPFGPRLPFALEADEQGLVRQSTFAAHSETLCRAYESGSLLSTPPGAEGYAARRAGELLDGLRRTGALRRGASVLEIGCGDGWVLETIAGEHGVLATGCDPGPGPGGARQSGIEVVKAPFVEGLFRPGSFDLVFSSMVLEHVLDPFSFLRTQIAVLAPGGTLFAAVPDCGLQLETGDLNLPAHQHASYFSGTSLSALLRRAGLDEVTIRQTDGTLSLQGWARKCDAVCAAATAGAGLTPDLTRFSSRFQERLRGLQARAAGLRGRRLAICGASTGAALVTGLLGLDAVEVRILDSDPAKRGRFLPGVDHPIAGDELLDCEPADEVWVLPTLHGRSIASALRQRTGLPADRIIVQC